MEKIKGLIFDLDGVIVDTAKYHFLAWRKMANSIGFDFSREENEKLKGVSRMGSLNLILQWAGVEKTEEEKKALAAQKNEWYLEWIEQMTKDEILPGVLPLLDRARENGLKVALGSASKNARTILTKVDILDRFEVLADGNSVSRSKPDPEVFEIGAAGMGIKPHECIVFEDAEKGVEAALRGGFYAVGIGSPEVLGAAHLVIPSFVGDSLESIIQRVLEKELQQ